MLFLFTLPLYATSRSDEFFRNFKESNSIVGRWARQSLPPTRHRFAFYVKGQGRRCQSGAKNLLAWSFFVYGFGITEAIEELAFFMFMPYLPYNGSLLGIASLALKLPVGTFPWHRPPKVPLAAMVTLARYPCDALIYSKITKDGRPFLLLRKATIISFVPMPCMRLPSTLANKW